MTSPAPTIESYASEIGICEGKHIVLISHELSQTGAPLLLVETAARLQQAGAQIELATLANDADRSSVPARYDLKMVSLADSFERSAQADLVIANTAVSGAWVKQYLSVHPKGGRSLICWVHEIDVHNYGEQMHSLNQASVAIFDSNAALQNWRRAGIEFPRFARVLHPCVDEALIEKALRCRHNESLGVKTHHSDGPGLDKLAIREELGLKADDFVVVIVGTYEPAKGHDLLMQTLSKLLKEHPSLPLKAIVVGFINEEAKLEFLSALDEAGQKAVNPQCALTVVEDLAPYYAAADAFVMNSQGLGETFGRVNIEAMTFSLPVLGTEAGGTLEIIENGVTGLLHRVGHEGQLQLAQNILTLMTNRAKAKAMGAAGFERVCEKFTGRRFYPELASILNLVFEANRS